MNTFDRKKNQDYEEERMMGTIKDNPDLPMRPSTQVYKIAPIPGVLRLASSQSSVFDNRGASDSVPIH